MWENIIRHVDTAVPLNIKDLIHLQAGHHLCPLGLARLPELRSQPRQLPPGLTQRMECKDAVGELLSRQHLIDDGDNGQQAECAASIPDEGKSSLLRGRVLAL